MTQTTGEWNSQRKLTLGIFQTWPRHTLPRVEFINACSFKRSGLFIKTSGHHESMHSLGHRIHVDSWWLNVWYIGIHEYIKYNILWLNVGYIWFLLRMMSVGIFWGSKHVETSNQMIYHKLPGYFQDHQDPSLFFEGRECPLSRDGHRIPVQPSGCFNKQHAMAMISDQSGMILEKQPTINPFHHLRSFKVISNTSTIFFEVFNRSFWGQQTLVKIDHTRSTILVHKAYIWPIASHSHQTITTCTSDLIDL